MKSLVLEWQLSQFVATPVQAFLSCAWNELSRFCVESLFTTRLKSKFPVVGRLVPSPSANAISFADLFNMFLALFAGRPLPDWPDGRTSRDEGRYRVTGITGLVIYRRKKWLSPFKTLLT